MVLPPKEVSNPPVAVSISPIPLAQKPLVQKTPSPLPKMVAKSNWFVGNDLNKP